ncbi:hypothetical protein M8C13_25590 [Crossiella sp. SN42]|uniref:hypothetical protein n=1 Tax=Crossiella sp. SN42 TaxID=2944808 RepID=UPI00207C46DD|nr:hypothetical protein [Crossiella sp. SN42]MCO1579128.1 hypothetical protein [Crossiella sp. SN42]
MNTSTPFPEPNDDDVERAVAELENYVAAHAPAAADPAPPAAAPATERPRDLHAEVDEVHVLLELQADAAPLLVDTDRVRRSRKRAAEAARLHILAQDPAARAWQASRVRLVLTAAALTALVGALAVTLTLDVWLAPGHGSTRCSSLPTPSARWSRSAPWPCCQSSGRRSRPRHGLPVGPIPARTKPKYRQNAPAPQRHSAEPPATERPY